jgi:hypothetical protein
VAQAEVAALQAAAADLKVALGRKEERLRSSMGALQRVSSSLRESWVGSGDGGGGAVGVSGACTGRKKCLRLAFVVMDRRV